MLAGSADATLWMWNIPTGNVMNVFGGHSAAVMSGGFTPNGKHIVSGSEDGTIFVWDPRTAEILARFTNLHETPVTCLAFHPDSNLVLTGSQDGTAKLIHIGGQGRVTSSRSKEASANELLGPSYIRWTW